jgi:hypothetical protein
LVELRDALMSELNAMILGVCGRLVDCQRPRTNIRRRKKAMNSAAKLRLSSTMTQLFI